MAANHREDAAASSSMNPAAVVQREDVPRSLTLQCCFLSLGADAGIDEQERAEPSVAGR